MAIECWNDEELNRQYSVGKTVGIGFFGKVRRAVHKASKHVVAIKAIARGKLEEIANTYGSVSYYKVEIEILKSLRHPNVVELFQVIETDHTIFLILEFANGGELFDYIASKGRLQENEAADLFKQLILGLEFCHARNIFHRDLKTENILLERKKTAASSSNKRSGFELQLKISDFGLGRKGNGNSNHLFRTSCGSPFFSCPDKVSGIPYRGDLSDIWSCGVILYVMLVGALPFVANTLPGVFQKITTVNYSIPDHLSFDASDLISRILVKDPLSRLTLEEIKRHPFLRQKEMAGRSFPPKEISIPKSLCCRHSIYSDSSYSQRKSSFTRTDGESYLTVPIIPECTELESRVVFSLDWEVVSQVQESGYMLKEIIESFLFCKLDEVHAIYHLFSRNKFNKLSKQSVVESPVTLKLEVPRTRKPCSSKRKVKTLRIGNWLHIPNMIK